MNRTCWPLLTASFTVWSVDAKSKTPALVSIWYQYGEILAQPRLACAASEPWPFAPTWTGWSTLRLVAAARNKSEKTNCRDARILPPSAIKIRQATRTLSLKPRTVECWRGRGLSETALDTRLTMKTRAICASGPCNRVALSGGPQAASLTFGR